MATSDWITVTGAAVTLISMVVSIIQANRATKAATAVKSSAISERLKLAQEHIRDIQPTKVLRRGFKYSDYFDLIRREFDTALSALPSKGYGSTARNILRNAQEKLNEYHNTITKNPDDQIWQELQILVQDTISELTLISEKWVKK